MVKQRFTQVTPTLRNIYTSYARTLPYPKNLLRLFFRNNLTRLKITSEVKKSLSKAIFDLVLKEYFSVIFKNNLRK